MPFYKYLEQHPENLKIFGEAMTSLSGTENPECARAFRTVRQQGGIRTLVDVAGGFGSLLALILKQNPTLKGVLFDMPPVIARARQDRHLTAPGIAAAARSPAATCSTRCPRAATPTCSSTSSTTGTTTTA